eukprot:363682-Chlamydomonas_euryale.AAC.3
MTLVGKSDLSTANSRYASYVLKSNDLKFVFTAPLSRKAWVYSPPTQCPLESFDNEYAHEFVASHGLAVRALGARMHGCMDARAGAYLGMPARMGACTAHGQAWAHMRAHVLAWAGMGAYAGHMCWHGQAWAHVWAHVREWAHVSAHVWEMGACVGMGACAGMGACVGMGACASMNVHASACACACAWVPLGGTMRKAPVQAPFSGLSQVAWLH